MSLSATSVCRFYLSCCCCVLWCNGKGHRENQSQLPTQPNPPTMHKGKEKKHTHKYNHSPIRCLCVCVLRVCVCVFDCREFLRLACRFVSAHASRLCLPLPLPPLNDAPHTHYHTHCTPSPCLPSAPPPSCAPSPPWHDRPSPHARSTACRTFVHSQSRVREKHSDDTQRATQKRRGTRKYKRTD